MKQLGKLETQLLTTLEAPAREKLQSQIAELTTSIDKAKSLVGTFGLLTTEAVVDGSKAKFPAEMEFKFPWAGMMVNNLGFFEGLAREDIKKLLSFRNGFIGPGSMYSSSP